jgi:hypothetical protein
MRVPIGSIKRTGLRLREHAHLRADADTAELVTFSAQVGEVRSVTLRGDVYDPSGAVGARAGAAGGRGACSICGGGLGMWGRAGSLGIGGGC